MAFGTHENSRDLGEPIQLFLFRYGPDPEHIYAYTNGETAIEMAVGDDMVEFVPAPIARGEISSSGTLDNQRLTVVFPESLLVYELFRDRSPSSVVNIIIWRGHANDPDEQFVIEWSGRVVSFNDTNYEVELSCEAVATMMGRNALRRRWQYGCAHALYSQGPGMCNANRAAATTPFVIGAVSGTSVTIDLAASEAAYGALPRYADFATPKRLYYVGGVLEYIDDAGRKALRSIIHVIDATSIRIGAPVPGMAAGAHVKLVFGCNHKTGISSLNDGGHCGPVHNNIQNFGGQPWIPLKSPIGLRNIYR
ncbi:phage BR0599 family protein [Sphingobium lignivorans]|nr:phage BR0599 family protein [Sphingobium lignivorans]